MLKRNEYNCDCEWFDWEWSHGRKPYNNKINFKFWISYENIKVSIKAYKKHVLCMFRTGKYIRIRKFTGIYISTLSLNSEWNWIGVGWSVKGGVGRYRSVVTFNPSKLLYKFTGLTLLHISFCIILNSSFNRNVECSPCYNTRGEGDDDDNNFQYIFKFFRFSFSTESNPKLFSTPVAVSFCTHLYFKIAIKYWTATRGWFQFSNFDSDFHFKFRGTRIFLIFFNHLRFPSLIYAHSSVMEWKNVICGKF